MNKIIPSLILFLVLTYSVQAEYRAYQYIVKSKINKNPQTNTNLRPNIVVSSLNPTAYISYHGGKNQITVELISSWICPGNTARSYDYCLSPYAKALVSTSPPS